MTQLVPAIAATALAIAVAGCGGSGGEPAEATSDVLVYLLRGEQVAAVMRQVPESGDLPRAAVGELLEGPTDDEAAAGIGTTIPEGTELRGLEIVDGIATVDLSGAFDDGGGSAAMFTRLAEVVHTLTQFPEVESVLFEVDGELVQAFSSEGIVLDDPQTRADYEGQAPAILVESPALNDRVRSPLRLAGTANTFEANFQYELVAADGSKLASGFVTATCGTGCRGTFDEELTFDAGSGDEVMLVVWEPSAENGSRTKVVEVPLAVGGG
jgi:hypothetical protein